MLPTLEICSEILNQASKKKLLVIGDIMLDHYVWGDATRISPEAPVPVVSVFKDNYIAGGAANVALNIAHLNAGRISLCGWMGRDDGGKILLELLKKNRIEILSDFVAEEIATILKARVMVQTQQLCRIDRENPPKHYAVPEGSARSGMMEAVRQADGVILSDYGKGMIDASMIAEIRSITNETGAVLSMDPKPRRKMVFSDLDIMTPNRSESLELAGIQCGSHDPFPAEAVCKAIWEKHHPRSLLITLGAEGMVLCEEGRVLERISTTAKEVFDVSGAGDTVISALTLALTVGIPLVDAAKFANFCAGIVVAKIGTATLSSEEILSKLEG
jgi:D-beta-D-heptose 7-phosphate kinase/D-beta-D-heptose 1-phosphate adenosyltransferase